jgi:hypothetical protein
VSVYAVFLLSCVQAAALRLADHSSKEPYRLCKKDYGTEEEARAQQRAAEPLTNKNGIKIMRFKIRNFLFISARVRSVYKGISHQYKIISQFRYDNESCLLPI